jgi:hypothetical protein
MCHTELQASSVADLLICGSQTFFVQKMAEDVISRWARRRLEFIPFSCHSPICVSNMRLACHSYPTEGRFQLLAVDLTCIFVSSSLVVNLEPAAGALHGEISRRPMRLVGAHLSSFPFQNEVERCALLYLLRLFQVMLPSSEIACVISNHSRLKYEN